MIEYFWSLISWIFASSIGKSVEKKNYDDEHILGDYFDGKVKFLIKDIVYPLNSCSMSRKKKN